MDSSPTFRSMRPVSNWKNFCLTKIYRKSIDGDGLENLFPDEPDDFRWMVGDYCRAKYSADGLWYEGKVTSISGEFCSVRFFGYCNTQKVKVEQLKSSDGKEARSEQIRIAKALLNENNDESGDEGSNHSTSNGTVCDDPPPRRTRRVSKSEADGAKCADHLHRNCCASNSTTAPSESFHGRYMPFVLPQSPGTPAPPRYAEALHLLTDKSGIPKEHAPLLCSWYMSGYYTGLKQAGKIRNGCRCCNYSDE